MHSKILILSSIKKSKCQNIVSFVSRDPLIFKISKLNFSRKKFISRSDEICFKRNCYGNRIFDRQYKNVSMQIFRFISHKITIKQVKLFFFKDNLSRSWFSLKKIYNNSRMSIFMLEAILIFRKSFNFDKIIFLQIFWMKISAATNYLWKNFT